MHDHAHWLTREWEERELYADDTINLAGIEGAVLGEGIGLRNALFLQGCPKFCPGCKNLREKRLNPGSIQSVPDILDDLEAFRQARLPTVRPDPESAMDTILLLSAIQHLAWESFNSPITTRDVSGIPSPEYVRIAERFQRELQSLCRGRAPDHAPPGWTLVPVTGLTLSGGEPLLQRQGVRLLIEGVRERFPEWDICIYTGVYTLQKILADRELRDIVALSDTIKTGSFVWSQESVKHLYFGSDNQSLLDSRKSLEAGEPVPAQMPPAVERAISIGARIARENLVPRLKPELVRRPEAIPPETVEEFESLHGPVNEEIVDRLFDLVPTEPDPKRFLFLSRSKLNLLGIRTGPFGTGERSAVEIVLQGSNAPPAPDLGPGVSDLLPRKIVSVEKLFDMVKSAPQWRLQGDRTEEERERIRLNLALQDRLLHVQGTFYLLRSPELGRNLFEYQERIGSYRNRMAQFFVEGASGPPDSILIRGGDPSLQSDSVNAFCEMARDAGCEIWMEHRLPWEQLTACEVGRTLAETVDVLVLGRSFDGGPPSVVPFLSSSSQTIVRASSGDRWRPGFRWSEQIETFRSRFESARSIARFHPPTLEREFDDLPVEAMVVDWEEAPS